MTGEENLSKIDFGLAMLSRRNFLQGYRAANRSERAARESHAINMRIDSLDDASIRLLAVCEETTMRSFLSGRIACELFERRKPSFYRA